MYEAFPLFFDIVIMLLIFLIQRHLYRWPYSFRVEVLHVRESHSSYDGLGVLRVVIFNRKLLAFWCALVLAIHLFCIAIVYLVKGLRILSELWTEEFFDCFNSSDL